MTRDFSCGGVVLEGRSVLLVRVANFKNKKIWTFPKGHIEEGETCRQAALREVREETGYNCRVVSPLLRVGYRYAIAGEVVRKEVQWYLMDHPVRVGKPDPAEILEVRWAALENTASLLHYPSDHHLVDLVREILETKNGGASARRRSEKHQP